MAQTERTTTLFVDGEEVAGFQPSGNQRTDLDAARDLLRKAAANRRIHYTQVSSASPAKASDETRDVRRRSERSS